MSLLSLVETQMDIKILLPWSLFGTETETDFLRYKGSLKFLGASSTIVARIFSGVSLEKQLVIAWDEAVQFFDDAHFFHFIFILTKNAQFFKEIQYDEE